MNKSNVTKTNTQNAGHLVAILSWLVLFIMSTVVVSVLMVDIMGSEVEQPDSVFWPIIFACYGLGFILLIVARGLKYHYQWARYLAGFLAIVFLIAFPVGTVMGLFILSYLKKGWDEPSP
jgi:ABC-type transport system involved in multi-copper enzyme maturation permease subunit